MSDHFRNIYSSKAVKYDALVSREDYQGNLLKTIQAIRPLDGLDVVEFGAGTGRLTHLIVPFVNSIRAFDASAHMLEIARTKLQASPYIGWELAVADNRQMPVEDATADLTIAAWSFGHTTGWHPENWREEIGKAVREMLRILKPGGTAIIIETQGTGTPEPKPPSPLLAEYYTWLERIHGFTFQCISTDYEFASVEEAIELTRFFYGDEMAARVERDQIIKLPEFTGIWSKTL
jgi:ubiquinone/menaquinone biosynthesis C-methylase UbiE